MLPAVRRPLAIALFAGCGHLPQTAPPVVLRPVPSAASPPAPGAATASGDSTADDAEELMSDSDGPAHALDALKTLTDEVGPRLAGTPADAAAVAWAEQTMAALGLEHVHREPVTVPRWERGVETASLVSPPQSLAVTALGGSVGTPPAGLEAELVRAEGLDDLAQLPAEQVRGRIVYLGGAMERGETMEGYGKAVGARVLGAIAAAKKGAVAVVIRSVGTDSNRLPHTGFVKMPAATDGVQAIPAAAISGPDADTLDRLYDLHRTLKLRLKLGCRRLPDGPSANVVGEVLGKRKPTEIVLLGAHLDSWDLGRGALDDGAGVAIALGAAHLIHRHGAPERTVRVVLFAGEEMAIAGARAYAAAHAGELGSHVAALEADQGDGEPIALRWLGAEASAALADELAAATGRTGAALETEPAHGGADVGPLVAEGVPAVDVVQNATRYFDFHHTANDTFDKIDADAFTLATHAYAIAAWTLAQADRTLGRVPAGQRPRK